MARTTRTSRSRNRARLAALGAAVAGAGVLIVCSVAPANAYTGDTAPVRTISGPNTRLTGADSSVAVSADGTLYVAQADFSAPSSSQVDVFAPGAHGDVAPIRVIAGPNTGITDASGIALAANGDIVVADEGADPLVDTGAILVFAPTANGNVKPIETLAGPGTTLGGGFLQSIAIDPAGRLWVVEQDGGPDAPNSSTGVGQVAIFGNGVLDQSGNVDTPPTTVIRAPASGLGVLSGIAIDSSGTAYISGGASPLIYVYQYPSNPVDQALPNQTMGVWGDDSDFSTASPNFLTIGPNQLLTQDNMNDTSVDDYSLSTQGQATATEVLAGKDTGLDGPDGVGYDSCGNLYVANDGNGNHINNALLQPSVTVYGVAANSVSPDTGDASGGTPVTITGAGFTSGTTVTVDGTPAANVDVVSSTQITATMPAHASGNVTVSVSSSCSPLDFTYTSTPGGGRLAFTGVDPTAGLLTGVALFAIGAVITVLARRRFIRVRRAH